jgi:hypothetical protein
VKRLLRIDGAVNILLGLLLILAVPFPAITAVLGLPPLESGFYGTVLGAVLAGIGLALLLESHRGAASPAGLGLGGAIAINICGAVALLAWLMSRALRIPLRGQILMLALVALLIGLSAIELLAERRRVDETAGD